MQLDSNDFCTNLSLPPRIYGAGTEPPDIPKMVIQHSSIDYVSEVAQILGKEEFDQIENSHLGSIVKLARRSSVVFSKNLFHFLMQRRVLTKGKDLWFTFCDQLMRFSMREFYLTTGLACEEDTTPREPLFPNKKKPYFWMLSKGDKYTVRNLYDLLKKRARTMTRLERLSMGVAIITEGVILAGHPSSLIPKERLLCYKNYDTFSRLPWGKLAYKILSKSIKRLNTSWWTGDSYEVRGFVLAINLWAMSSVPILGKAFGKPCEVTASSDPLCLHWDSTRAPTITEVLEVEKKSNVSFLLTFINLLIRESQRLIKRCFIFFTGCGYYSDRIM